MGELHFRVSGLRDRIEMFVQADDVASEIGDTLTIEAARFPFIFPHGTGFYQ